MFTIGTDPEFFIYDEKENKIKNANKIIKNDKNNKIKINQNYFYYDNVLAEAAIPPSGSKEEFKTNICNMLKDYQNLINKNGYIGDLKCVASHYFDKSELQDEESRIAGCEPENCAYELKMVLPDDTIHHNGKWYLNTNLRTAGGHIHLNSKIFDEVRRGRIFAIRMFDLFLGSLLPVIDNSITSINRSKTYGKMGRYRTPDHGIETLGLEYRTIGNFWLNHPKIVEFIYDISEFIINFINEKEHLKYWTVNEEGIQNDPDNIAKHHHCNGYKLEELREVIEMRIKKDKNEKFLSFVEKLLPNEIKKQIPDIVEINKNSNNLKKNWSIE